MDKDKYIMQLPLPILERLVRMFRYTRRIHERLEFIYYSKVAQSGSPSKSLQTGKKTDNNVQKPENQRPVFVLSTGRCGTKTLAWLMDLHSDIASHHEPHPRLIETSYLYYMNACSELPEDFWQTLLGFDRDDLIQRTFSSNRVYFESNNRLSMVADLLAERYPKARFIHLVRHPFDFIISAMRRGYYRHSSWDFARITPRKGEEYYDEWATLSYMEKSAWLWTQTNAHIQDTLKTVSDDQKILVQSEEIFSGLTPVIHQLFNFVSHKDSIPSKARIEKVLGSKLNKQLDGYFPKPSEWTRQEKENVLKIVESLARDLGYQL